MEIPFVSEIRKRLDAKLAPVGAESVLGIDIGTTSVKVVQLRRSGGRPVLETYGDIELGAYGNANPGEAVHLSPQKNAAAVLDLLHEVEASARSGGMAIPLSSSLVSVVELPKRDPEQMNRIIRSDAKKFIPVSIEKVTLDWLPIPDEEFSINAFDKAEEKIPVKVKMQKIFLAATDNDALEALRQTSAAADLRVAFYEIESFSAIRSAADTTDGPILIIDFGAGTTKMCIASRDHFLRAAHAFDFSGQKITEAIMREARSNFKDAETLKRSIGLSALSDPAPERSRISLAIKPAIDSVFAEAKKIIGGYNSDYKTGVANAVFIGGGADMPGLVEYGARELGMPAKRAWPFSKASLPMILEPVLREVGPRFAVAMGLALRAQEGHGPV